MDGTEYHLSCHPKLVPIKKKKTNHHPQFRKNLFPSKIHGHALNTSETPFDFIPGELYRIISPTEGI